jgi:hypothetical protein
MECYFSPKKSYSVFCPWKKLPYNITRSVGLILVHDGGPGGQADNGLILENVCPQSFRSQYILRQCALRPRICIKYFLSFPQKTCNQRKLKQTFNFWMITLSQTLVLPKDQKFCEKFKKTHCQVYHPAKIEWNQKPLKNASKLIKEMVKNSIFKLKNILWW